MPVDVGGKPSAGGRTAGATCGAARGGGDLVCKGDVGARTGIDQKGGTIIVGGRTGAFSGFMMQRGRMIILGDAGKNLGDSMYDGTIYVGGAIRSLGVDAIEGELTESDRAWLERKLGMYELLPEGGLDRFTQIVAAKQPGARGERRRGGQDRARRDGLEQPAPVDEDMLGRRRLLGQLPAPLASDRHGPVPRWELVSTKTASAPVVYPAEAGDGQSNSRDFKLAVGFGDIDGGVQVALRRTRT